MKKGWMLIVVVITSFLYIQPATFAATTLEFRQIRGNTYNGTTASYYGFGINDLQVLVVAGKETDNYAVHLVIYQKSLDYILQLERNDQLQEHKINSTMITMVNYPGLIAMRKTVGDTEIPVAALNFRNLDWKIAVNKERTLRDEGNLQISVSAQQHIESHIYSGDVSLQLNFKFLLTRHNGEQTTQIITLSQNGVSVGNTTKAGSIVESSIKIDHILQSNPAISADIVKLPIYVETIHTMIGLRSLPIQRLFVYTQRNVNDTEAPPEFSFKNSQLSSFKYSWDRKISVDGSNRKVQIDAVHILPTRTIRAVNSSYGIITNKISINLQFLYPAGSIIIHDPTFSSAIFIDALPFINLQPKKQLLAELVALVLFSVLMFRKLKKRH